MMNRSTLRILLGVSITIGLGAILIVAHVIWKDPSVLVWNAEAAESETIQTEGDAALAESIRRILTENYEIIDEAIDRYVERSQLKKAAQQRLDASRQKNATKHFATLLQGPRLDLVSEPNEDTLILVEFFDYRCPHCRAGVARVKEFLRRDGNTQFVLAELPVLQDISAELAQVSIAAWLQVVRSERDPALSSGDFFGFHEALLDPGSQELPDAPRALALATQFGFDLDTLEADRRGVEVETIITRNFNMAGEIGLNSTPGFLLFSADGMHIEGFPGAHEPEYFLYLAEQASLEAAA